MLSSGPHHCLFGPRGTLGLQLSGIVCFLSVVFWDTGGSSCRALSVLFVCHFWASTDTGAPFVGYCLFFLSVTFAPRGELGFQLSGITVCPFWRRRHKGSRYYLFFLSSVFRASRCTRAPAVGYRLIFLSVIFGARGTLGLQLSGIVCFFLSATLGQRGRLGLQLSEIVCLFLALRDI